MSEITTQTQPQMTIKQLIGQSVIQEKLRAVAATSINSDKLGQALLLAVNRNPDLQKCSANSLLDCLMIASQYGWSIGGPRPGLYLVPFKGVATPIPSYYGLMEIARRSGVVQTIEAAVVIEGDEFRYARGLIPKLEHVPHDEDGPITHAYAIARFASGEIQFDVMTKADIDKIRARSRAGSGPWVTDYNEMAKKTVVRRLVKYLPSNPDVDAAIELSDKSELIETEASPTPVNAAPARRMRMGRGSAQQNNAGETGLATDKEGASIASQTAGDVTSSPAPSQTPTATADQTPSHGATAVATSEVDREASEYAETLPEADLRRFLITVDPKTLAASIKLAGAAGAIVKDLPLGQFSEGAVRAVSFEAKKILLIKAKK